MYIDTHLDDVPELIENKMIYGLLNENDVIQFSRYEGDLELRMDNFIFPSFVRDTVDHIYHVSNPGNEKELSQNHIDLSAIKNAGEGNDVFLERVDTTSEYILFKIYEEIKGKAKSISRIKGIEELKLINMNDLDKSMILDLDLDYFNDSTIWRTAELKSEEIIRKNLNTLKEFFEWDLITVALSPTFCGEDDDCLYLLTLFLEIFEVSLSDFEYYL